MKDRSDDPSHHERTLLPQNYILLMVNDFPSTKTSAIALGGGFNMHIQSKLL